jgi:uncharacterized protein (TIGR03000 family)
MMKQRSILLSAMTAVAVLFASGPVFAGGGGGHGGGGHGGGGVGHIGGGHATVVHAGGGHITAVHAGNGHVTAVHVNNFHNVNGFHNGGFNRGFGGVGVFVGGFPFYGYGGYGYGGYGYGAGYYAPLDATPVYNYQPYVPVPVEVPVPVPSYTPPMPPAQVQTPGTGDKAPADPIAHLQIKLPVNAELWIEGEKTKQTGDTREFTSPELTLGRTFVYEMKARWTEDGKEVVKTKRIPVQAGAWIGIDFTRPDNPLPLPKPGTP